MAIGMKNLVDHKRFFLVRRCYTRRKTSLGRERGRRRDCHRFNRNCFSHGLERCACIAAGAPVARLALAGGRRLDYGAV